MEVSAEIVAIAEAEAGHTVAGRRVAGEVVARTLGARHTVAGAAAVRRNPLAVGAGSIGRVEVRRRRVEEEAGLHMVVEMAHRRVEEGVVARSPGEVEEAVGSIGLEREVEARRTAAEEAVAGSTPLAVGEAALIWSASVSADAPEQPWGLSNTHDHMVGTRNKTSREMRYTRATQGTRSTTQGGVRVVVSGFSPGKGGGGAALQCTEDLMVMVTKFPAFVCPKWADG